MNCAEWEERIALHQGGDLPLGQAATVERHLGECPGCQVFASGLRETLSALRSAHGQHPADAHFAAVRARVLAELAHRQRPAWRRGLAWGSVAAGLAALAVGAAWFRPVPSLPAVALARPAAPELQPPAPSPPRRVRTAPRRPAPRVVETVTIKLLTDNPDVVIYWIADRKGE